MAPGNNPESNTKLSCRTSTKAAALPNSAGAIMSLQLLLPPQPQADTELQQPTIYHGAVVGAERLTTVIQLLPPTEERAAC